MASNDTTLREAAKHRGLKLVKSRKRKPGVGDYGHFGLKDADGKALFGIGADGLTATAREIADYLRKGEASTWAESAKVTPERAAQDKIRSSTRDDNDIRASAIRVRPQTNRRAIEEPPTEDEPERRDTKTQTGSATKAKASEQIVEATPEPKPAPELSLRTARPGDAEALVRIMGLIGFSGSESEMGRSIASASRRKEPIIVADRGDVVGCVAWHIVPFVQNGPIARITALVVDKEARREGIGRALYEAAVAEIAKHDVDRIEAMSEIEVRNANGFYRALGLSQASYRFVSKP